MAHGNLSFPFVASLADAFADNTVSSDSEGTPHIGSAWEDFYTTGRFPLLLGKGSKRNSGILH